MTTVVIAHRLSTIKDSDNILVMQYGQLKEQGNHDSLLREYPDGIYAQFVRQQEDAEKKQEEEPNNEPELVDVETVPDELRESLHEMLDESKRFQSFTKDQIIEKSQI